MSQSVDALFQPIQLGANHLANRMAMAPLTRCRAPGHQPNELMAEYYGQRASAGLIISECTMIQPNTSSFATEPGIYSKEQIEGWKLTTKAVHEKDGKIFMQIWHAGRAVHPALNVEENVVSASDIGLSGETHTPDGKQPYVAPKPLTREQIRDIIGDFRQAAANAIEAGFDGVEIHSANGYLIDQFLRDGSNKRDDEYGGSLENRARFFFEVIEAVSDEIGSDRVGVRLSPLNSFNDMQDSDPEAFITYLSQQLNQFELAYLHLMRADFFGQQQADVVSIARENYKGNLMVNMGYSGEEAAAVIEAGHADMVAFGVPFLANPDLPARIKAGAALNEPDQSTFYTQGAEGYTTYPTM
ncbi:alkene reductase [Bermanella marisrubri]|uniref:NADH:flavin oxidoreductase/NADH oxidase n=1 Tax=Bermanella marisrubri TaxID=207949 RepID=Q1N2S7_9GAMM|nr:alkene reductase [Bermanella marisrubri]EAT12592.1 NADH:flavin oxidoreductase/NADH oxidase [Oceanobacter sp. RED65] [Bermanella marisrubri]QIZ84855.1 alkene reductase [Bermanella marisrubri]